MASSLHDGFTAGIWEGLGHNGSVKIPAQGHSGRPQEKEHTCVVLMACVIYRVEDLKDFYCMPITVD